MNTKETSVPKEVRPKGIIKKKSLTSKQKLNCSIKHNKLMREEREIRRRVEETKLFIVKKDQL